MQQIQWPRQGCFWSSCQHLILLVPVVLLGILTARLCADQIIYDDALQPGWQDWSYFQYLETNNFNYSGTYVHSGSKSISVTIASGWGALSLNHDSIDSSIYTNLTFWINGGAGGGQQLQIYAELSSGGGKPAIAFPALVANNWQQMTFSLAELGVADQPNFTRFTIQDRSGAPESTFYVDDISLTTNAVITGTNAPVTITVDASANRHPISTLIYGVAFASSASDLQDLNAPLHRSGGNAETRYNWQLNATSRAADWYFESIADDNVVGGDGDDFIQESKSGGAQAMLTIPIIGWVAKLGPGRSILASYSTNTYGPQTGSDPYLSSAGNGTGTNKIAHTSWLIITNEPTDANMTADTNFQAGWVQHLTNQWGTATNGGLRYYIMDNEWSLWNSTHRDVHPVGATMDEVFTNFCNYATMVKAIDPNALVAGPEEWGWPGYLYSGFDQQWSGAHNDFNPADYPDRQAHGGQDFGPWFLSQVQQRSQAAGTAIAGYSYPALLPAGRQCWWRCG